LVLPILKSAVRRFLLLPSKFIVADNSEERKTCH
jgi:hypothetical protein